MLYFDCCCEVGPRNGKDPAAPWTTRDVLRGMDRCGIAGALVVHTLSYANDPVNAREALAKEIALAPDRLFPVWVALPPDAGDFEPTPGEFVAALDRASVRAVKLYPTTHNWPFRLDVIGPTLKALETKRILTMIDFNELPDGKAGGPNHGAYAALDHTLAVFPDLPLLAQQTWWSAQRTVTALMSRHPNLHIEFSAYQINRGIEEYSRRFGADRLLFGTGQPAKSPGAARALVDYAQIPPADREKIAGGNLARLLGVRPAPAPAQSLDPIRAAAAEGKPMPVLALDAHCHILHRGGNGAGNVVMYRGDADGLIGLKDVMGVRRTAIMSWSGPCAGDVDQGNAIVEDAVAAYPDRFLGAVYVNPALVPRDVLMAEVRRLVEGKGFVALKPYPRVGLKYDDPLYAPCWEYANSHSLYALLHIGGEGGGTDTVQTLAAKYPDAQWVIAHTGGSFGMARKVAAAMKQCPNIWAELTLTPVTNGVIEWLAAEVGDDRILFGTDAPMRDPRPQLGWVVWSDLSVASRKKILGENYQRLLSLRRV